MNRILALSLIAIALAVKSSPQAPPAASDARSLSDNKPPVPIWSGEGNVPAGSDNQRVFLTPDLHSIVLLWKNSDGTEKKRRFPLHNEIDPSLRVRIEGNSGLFRYRYDLENGKDSKDSLTNFSIVIYPDQDVELSSAEWSKGDVASGARERFGIPGAPSGAFAYWTYTLRNPLFLKPGMSTNFTVITSAKPGFTSAATEHFPHDEHLDGWPEEDLPQETIDQLMLVWIGRWIPNHLITLGPRYGFDYPDAGIAADYLTGIEELIRVRRLEKDSLFVKEAIADLDAIASGSVARFKITKKPSSELEAEILSGLELSLDLTYKAPQ